MWSLSYFSMIWPWFVTSLIIMQPFMGKCIVTLKRHLSVDFEADHRRAPDGIISAHRGISRRICMLKCAADVRCTAFNFRSGDGFCELLPELPKCYEPDEDNDFIFTQLKQSDFKPAIAIVKQTKPPDTSYLQWVPCNSNTFPSSSNIQVSHGRFVALCFYKGLYLPATWIHSSKEMKSFYPPGNRKVRCDHGYLLSVQSRNHFKWASFRFGNPIPVGSVSAGSHVDATPFYIVRVMCQKGERSGFYAPSLRRAYVGCLKPVILEGEIEILFYVEWESLLPLNEVLPIG